MTDKTEIEWSYTPANALEYPARLELSLGILTLDAGRARLTLNTAQDPLCESVKQHAQEETALAIQIWQVETGSIIELSQPHIVQHQRTGERRIIASVPEMLGSSELKAEARVIDEHGNLVLDSQPQWEESEGRKLADLHARARHSPKLQRMVKSLANAVRDPTNALVHYYEVRDAASKHWAGDVEAQQALGITSAEWTMLGRHANNPLLLEGRHRGKALHGARAATLQELDEARLVAMRIFHAQAKAPRQ